ncbi:MAG: Gx transporter family protein [Lachnospiraceae bacterium]|nr:Gx transporter family protein [Lachnospiraceae bacterium]
MNKKTERIALYGLCIALAFVLSYIEFLIPIQAMVPGMKLGLTNLVVIFALYRMGEKSAFVVNVVRMLLVSFTFGNMKSLLYSLAGGILSYVVMIVLKRVKSFGMVTVSVAGGIFHNVGQILVAMAIVETTAIIWYLTVLFFTGILSGFFVGFISWMIIKKIPGNIEEF